MSYIKLECETCKSEHRTSLTDLSLEAVGSEERAMGVEVTYEAEVEFECKCGQSIEIIYRLWEYPEGVQGDSELDVSGAKVIED